MAVNQVKRNGSYAPLSCRYYQDDAVAKAGEKAELLDESANEEAPR